METVWYILQFLIGYNLVLPLLLFVLWAVFSKKNTDTLQTGKEADYAFIVTAFLYTDNLKNVVQSIRNINYSNYLIYIVADNCDISNLHFEDDHVILLRPEEVIASNTGSHLYACQHFVRAHDRITIIDSDNMVEKDYLNHLNAYFDKGYIAVQGVRAAKNLDTTLSCLDAARDIYYHFYDGKVLHQLGSSATLAGSGMAFEAKFYIDFLKQHDIKGAGFDKILQHDIIKQDLRIAFAEKAVVYDEKSSQSDQLVKQRARWINTWFKYFKFGFSLMAKSIKNLSLNQFLFGLILLRPPLFIFLLLSVLFLAINLAIGNFLWGIIWMVALSTFILGFLIALWRSETDARIYKSLKAIPKFMFLQVISLIKSRNANKHSIATKHYHHQDTN